MGNKLKRESLRADVMLDGISSFFEQSTVFEEMLSSRDERDPALFCMLPCSKGFPGNLPDSCQLKVATSIQHSSARAFQNQLKPR